MEFLFKFMTESYNRKMGDRQRDVMSLIRYVNIVFMVLSRFHGAMWVFVKNEREQPNNENTQQRKFDELSYTIFIGFSSSSSEKIKELNEKWWWTMKRVEKVFDSESHLAYQSPERIWYHKWCNNFAV